MRQYYFIVWYNIKYSKLWFCFQVHECPCKRLKALERSEEKFCVSTWHPQLQNLKQESVSRCMTMQTDLMQMCLSFSRAVLPMNITAMATILTPCLVAAMRTRIATPRSQTATCVTCHCQRWFPGPGSPTDRLKLCRTSASFSSCSRASLLWNLPFGDACISPKAWWGWPSEIWSWQPDWSTPVWSWVLFCGLSSFLLPPVEKCAVKDSDWKIGILLAC